MVRKNNAGFTKFADVIILETPTPLCHPLQTSELVDEVTCIVDGNHSFYVSSIKTSLFFNFKKEINEIC